MNKTYLIGRLTKDIDLRYINSNKAVGTTSIAVNRPKQKDKEQEADFINIVLWGNTAENCSKYIGKGSQIAIEGRIQTRSYETENGQKRYVFEVVAENVEFLDSKKQNCESQSGTQNVPQNNPYREMGNQVSADFQDEEGYPWEI